MRDTLLNLENHDPLWHLLDAAPYPQVPPHIAPRIMRTIRLASEQSAPAWQNILKCWTRYALPPLAAACVIVAATLSGLDSYNQEEIETDITLTYAEVCDFDSLLSTAYADVF